MKVEIRLREYYCTWPSSCWLTVVPSRVVCGVLIVVGVEVQHNVVDAVDGRGGLTDGLRVLLYRRLEADRAGREDHPDWQVVRGLQDLGPDVLVLVSRVLGGVGQLLGDVEVGGGGGGGGDVAVDVVPAVLHGVLRRARCTRGVLVVRCEERPGAEAGDQGGLLSLLSLLALLPYSDLQQVEKLLCPPALEGVNTRAHSLPPGLETEQPVLQKPVTTVTRGEGGGGEELPRSHIS